MKIRRLTIAIIMLVILLISSNSDLQASSHYEKMNAPLNEVSSFNNIVIFIRFADETDYTPPFDYEHYDTIFNGVDQVSLRDYFLEVSYNKLTIDTYFMSENNNIIFYTAPNPRSYYQPQSDTNPNGYNENNMDNREHELLKQAIDWVELSNAIDESIVLDSNNDGDIDNLVFMISGEDDGWGSLLWPHQWALTNYYDYILDQYKYDAPTINGYNAWSYTIELLGNSTQYPYNVSVGILAHELFHLIGATDLYHYYRYEWLEPTGRWGIMDDTESVPSHMLGYMKYQYGRWIESVPEITESGKYTLYPLQDSENNIYRIDLGYGNEYIYIEYRDNEGFYESTLPDDGLIIYHVDEDFIDIGNVEGYYDLDFNTSEEVWLYRPSMADTTEPIEFDDVEPTYDVDGNPNNAALSQLNMYDEAGRNTDILFFDSDGNLINMKITDVEIKDGYVEFIAIVDDTRLDLNHEFLEVDEAVNYLDLPGTEYSFHIDGIPAGFEAYYTIDETTPSIYDTPYTGEDIEFDAENNIFKLGLFYEGVMVDMIVQEFTFVPNFETKHDGYHNFRVEYWYLNFEKITTFEVEFDNFFELEVNFDQVSLIERDGTISSFRGTELSGQLFTYTSKGLVLQFDTDYSIDDFYGFKADVEVLQTFDTIGYYINGEAEQFIQIYGEYVEEYITLVGEDAENSYYSISSEVNTNQAGIYYVYYSIFNPQNELIDVLRRTVHIVDDEKPVVALIGEENVYVEFGEEYIEQGATYTDNGPVSSNFDIVSNIVIDVVGVYEVTYQITDDAGNESEVVTRYVHIIDTVAPTAILNPGIDTVDINGTWIDAGVLASDNYDTELNVVLMNWSDELTSTEGSVKVTYEVSDSSGNTFYIDRYINVVKHEYNKVDMGCSDTVTTILVNGEVEIPECDSIHTVNNIDISDVDVEHTGAYVIYIDITIDNVDYMFRTYVFVVDRIIYDNELHYYDKKRREKI